ncbi:MAG TPA: gephyrin-like molybdotransferase Glp [Streptosporangiaceae bacterium]|jgi:molybdopterin molybdotransferase
MTTAEPGDSGHAGHGGHGGHGHEVTADMVSVDQHVADVAALVRPLSPTDLPLTEAEGCVLAADLTAGHQLPPFDNSAMDGYAVRAADVAGATDSDPVTLPVTGEVAAGDTGAYGITPGMCLRIMTGALMPGGADAVVPVEWTDGGTAKVAIRRPAEAGNAVRRAGGDARGGDVLLSSGTVLGPAQIGLAATAGHGTVPVRPRPRVVVISTGNELAEPGAPVIPGKIWESNSFMLAAAARQAGCLAYRAPIVPDDQHALLDAIEDQFLRADVIITSGGVSMGGENDVVKDVLRRLGTVTFRKVAMQPGMPQGFGVIGPDETPIFNLPGNPVSAYVSFQLFVRAALDAMLCTRELALPATRAKLSAPLRAPAGRRAFLRGVLNRSEGTVQPLSGQGSHQLAALGRANALIVAPEWVVAMKEGDEADVLILP